MAILRRFSVFLATVKLVAIPDSLGFRRMHTAMCTNDHMGDGGFTGGWFLAGSQGAFDDLQDQPQSDENNDETKKLTHSLGLGYQVLPERQEKPFRET